MKSPAFRFYPSDFMGSPDVQAMNLSEVGAYVFLLSTAWLSERHGFLPDDDEKLRRWAHMVRKQWNASRDILLAKFPVVEPGWRANPRLVREAEKQSAFSELQSEKGKRGGRPRKAEQKPELSSPKKPGLSSGKADEKPSVSASVSASGISSSNEEESVGAYAPEPARKDRRSNNHASSADGPATIQELKGTGLTPEDFGSYMAVRRKLRKAFIDPATRARWMEKFRRFYGEGKDTAGMLHQMIQGHWEGPVAEKWKERPKQWREATDADDIWGDLKGGVQ